MSALARLPNPHPLGFVYEHWAPGVIRIGCELEPRHLNPAGTVHGGVLLTLMDEAGALCGVFAEATDKARHSVTVALSSQFTGQARSGRIVVHGTLVRSGQRIYFSRTEVVDAQGELLAFGSSTHRYRNSMPG